MEEVCCICGNTNEYELIGVTERVTEGNYRPSVQCRDQVKCWERFDRKNGINKYQKQEAVKAQTFHSLV